MDTIFVPNENDFRRWIKEALKECLEVLPQITKNENAADEPLLTRKEVAAIFDVSLVTLHAWIKKGLPYHKQGGRVYFLKSEVFAYLKQKKQSGLSHNK